MGGGERGPSSGEDKRRERRERDPARWHFTVLPACAAGTVANAVEVVEWILGVWGGCGSCGARRAPPAPGFTIPARQQPPRRHTSACTSPSTVATGAQTVPSATAGGAATQSSAQAEALAPSMNSTGRAFRGCTGRLVVRAPSSAPPSFTVARATWKASSCSRVGWGWVGLGGRLVCG